MSCPNTNNLIQYNWDGAHTSVSWTNFLGYYKGQLSMKSYTMLPTQETKTYFLELWYLVYIALSV